MGRHRRDRPSVAVRARIGPSSPRGRSSAEARTEELHESVERAVHWQDPRDPTVGRELGSEGGLLRTEFERRGVDAVPQPRRPRPVIEHVSQVGTAVGTFDLRAAHEQAPILLLANISFLNGRPETRPAGPRVELGPRREEFGPADDAQIHARVVVVPIFAGEGSLGPLVHDDVVLKRRKLLLQLRLVELLHGLGRTLRRLKVSARSRRAKEPLAGPKSPNYICGVFGLCCPQASPGAQGSSNTANQPRPMTSAFRQMIFPPAFLTFSLYSS